MSTGLNSFSNPQEIGALYPGVGVEWIMVIVLAVLWVLWHIRITGVNEIFTPEQRVVARLLASFFIARVLQVRA